MKNNINKYIKPALLVFFITFSSSVFAKDNLLTFNFEDVLQKGFSEGVLDKDITFKLEGQQHKAVKKKFSEYKTNKKTRRLGKSEMDSCEWALLGALKALQSRAMKLNANAVINIKSNYKSREFISDTEYQCGSGFLMAGVALKATIVNL